MGLDEFDEVRSLADGTTEYCALWHNDQGWHLKGTAVGVLGNKRPMLPNYEIRCDENWLTRCVQVERTIGKETNALTCSPDS